ncbi:MAG: gliding motility-associated C-terminal domain-containing protein [Chitinophagaceae bacterium]|nr:gliding motility-associated C-terminal domain-containing protein [Chitinophagaceae bacterium]
MQKIFVVIAFVMSAFFVKGQTFNGTGGTIPGTSTTQTCFPINVTGVGNINDVNNGLASVCIRITHPYIDELEVVLKAPDGTTVPLTIQNGGSGNDYNNTCFSNSATTSIKFGTAPFSGTYIPEGYLGAVNNGQNANGAWRLCIQDRRTGANQGVLNTWSLTFNNTPAALPPAFPACANTLPVNSSCANATAVCDFNGLCGSTVGSSVQDWAGSGLAGCFGLQNNSFIKFIAASNTAAFTVWVPTNTGGTGGGIQMLFFSGTCDAGPVTTHGCYPHIFPYQSASDPLPTIITATGLTPGNTYYLMFDGFNNDNCTFRIAANTGITVVNITPAAPAICNGQSVNLTASGSSGAYTWSPGTGLNITSGATVTASPTATTIYTVNTTTSTGCVINKDVTVTVNALPVISTHPADTVVNVCQNGTVSPLSITATAGSGSITGYQWYITTNNNNTSGAAIPFATTSTYTPSTSSVGTLYFYCRVTNSNGCTDTSNVSGALIISPVVATPTASTTIQPTCTIPTGTIVVTAPAGANIQYNIDGGTYQAGGTFTGIAPGSHNITAKNIVTGCVSAVRVVTVNALPPGPATPVASVTVQPNCAVTTGTIVITAPLGANIEYSVGGAYQASTTFSGLTNGTTYSITAKDISTGCISAVSSLPVNPITGAPAAPGINTTQPDCNTATGTFTITSPLGANYEYSNGGTYQSGISFAGLTPGTNYAVTVKDINTGCISVPTNISISNISPIAAPIVTTPVTACQNSLPFGLTATGSSLLWYTTSSGGVGTSTVPVPSTTTAGNTDYYVSQTIGVCESPRALITVTIVAQPLAPAVTSAIPYCQNATAAALTATGSNLLWYPTLTGSTGSATAPTPTTASAGNTIYYVSQTVNGCESPRAVITVTLNPTPAAPVVTTTVNYCQNATAALLTATGTNLLWYSTLTGGVGSATAPTPVTTTSGNSIYYVSQTINSCEGPRAAITVTVNAIPAAPLVTSAAGYCQNATATALTATGSNLLWYTTLTGGTGTVTAPNPVTTAIGNTNYYVSQTVNGCESPRATITVTITAVPAAPLVTATISYCQNTTATALTATGIGLLWYSTSTGGTGSATAPTPVTTTAGNTIFYVSQTSNGCEGPRAVITVTINPTPALPTVTSTVSYCQNATAAVLTATGSNLLWYTTASGGTGSATAPTPVTTTAGNTTYYVSQTSNGCEGPRAAITVTVNAIPATPAVTSPVGYCQSVVSVALSATGSNLLWYGTANGGTGSAQPIVPSTTTVGSTNYYVSQTINGCESPRAAITVNIGAAPLAPTVTTPVVYCQNATATTLNATGSNLLWYTTSAGGTGTATAPTPVTGAAGNTIYYVSQTVNGCEGQTRAAITVTVNPTPALPTVTSAVTYCQNATATALNATGGNLLWYNTLTGGTGSAIAPTPVTTAAGSATYYVSQTTNNCEGPRAAITITVNPTPAAPTVLNNTLVYCQNETATALTAAGSNLLWYSTQTGGTGSSTAPTPATTTAGNSTYYVSQTINGCEGPRAAITITVNPTPAAPTVVSPVTYCQNNIAVPLTATGNNLLWYSAASGGTGSAIAPTPSTTTPGNTFYYVTQSSTGCESPRRAVTVTINITSTAVAGFQYTPDTVCRNGINPSPSYDFGFTNGGTFTATPAGLSVDAATGNINLANSTTGTYTVTYTYNTTGCIIGSSSSFNITLIPSVNTVTVFSYSSPVCKNAANVLPQTAPGFTTGGTFSSSNGLTINSSTGEIDVATSTPGQYQVAYRLSALGCRQGTTNFSFITIADTTSPVTSFGYSSTDVCISTGINPTITKPVNFATGGTFSATPAGLNINAATGAINIGLSVPGVYNILYNMPAQGCQLAGRDSIKFILRAYGNPVTSFSYFSPVCKGDDTATAVTDIAFTPGGVFSSTTGLSIAAATGIIDLRQSLPGNYTVRYDVTQGVCNPAGFGTTAINILAQPTAPTVSTAGICGSGNISLTANALGTISWYTEPALLNQVNVGDTYNTFISNTTAFYVTNTIGTCESEPAIANAVVSPIPEKPFLGADTSICNNDRLILNAGVYNSYLWQDGSTNSTYTVTGSEIYKVIVSTGVGCSDSASINVTILDNCDDILFPNAFSPTGTNRTFGALGNLFVASNYLLRIYNRYGETVFATADPTQRWDGTFKGKPVNIGAYVYVASYFYKNRINKVQKGTILLIR